MCSCYDCRIAGRADEAMEIPQEIRDLPLEYLASAALYADDLIARIERKPQTEFSLGDLRERRLLFLEELKRRGAIDSYAFVMESA